METTYEKFPQRYFVYLLRCADGTFYSGWTKDLTKRMHAHNAGKNGAKYTKSRRPVTIAACKLCATQSEAMQQEAAQKKLTHAQKEKLAQLPQGEECLTVYDGQMQPCGVLPRRIVHACGLRHRVVHVIVREMRGETAGIWLQQRGFDRPLLPGAYDWTATGHADPQETLPEAAARELREESGLFLQPSQLQFVGETSYHKMRGIDFLDDEIASTFVYTTTQTPSFAIGEETADMVWVPERELHRVFRQGKDLEAVSMHQGKRYINSDEICLSKQEWNRICTFWK